MAGKRNSGKTGVGTLVLLSLAAVLLLASAALGFKLVFPSGDGYRDIALERGQRLEFSLVTGEVTGLLLTSEEVLSNLPKPTTPVVVATPPSVPEPQVEDEISDAEVAADTTATEDAKEQPEVPLAASDAGKTPDTKGEVLSAEAPIPPVEDATSKTPEPPALHPPLSPVEKQLETGQVVPYATEAGQTAMRFFARSDFTAPSGTARIAIVISGIGLNQRTTEAATALPQNITLSFSPYGKQTADWAQAARAKGHEILLDLPAQTNRYPAIDPGPYGQLVTQDKSIADKRFLDALSRARGYVGLTLPENDSLSEDGDAIRVLLERLRAHGLLMVNSHAQPTEAMFNAIHRYGTPILHTQVILDAALDETSILNQLARAEDLSRRYGQILVLGRASPLTLGLLERWLPTLPEKRIALVPVSALLPKE